MSPVQIVLLVVGILAAQALMCAALYIRMSREIERLSRALRARGSEPPAAPKDDRMSEKLASGAAVIGAALVVGGVLLESTRTGQHTGVALLTVGVCLELGLSLAKFCTDLGHATG
jgi:hypothetical protein